MRASDAGGVEVVPTFLLMRGVAGVEQFSKFVRLQVFRPRLPLLAQLDETRPGSL